MFRTDLLSNIRGLNTVFTATGICNTGYVDCLLATVNIISMTNTGCNQSGKKTQKLSFDKIEWERVNVVTLPQMITAELSIDMHI